MYAHVMSETTVQSWKDVLGPEKEKPYFKDILSFVSKAATTKTIYPPKNLCFNALKLTPLDTVKVVILGQDPYHGPGQAHGLSFSVPIGIKQPPSLNNIFQELSSDIGFKPPNHGCLESWAQQGVLLLNSSLTVEHGMAGSHSKIGWDTFTDFIISAISQHREHVVFLLWGSFAQKKAHLIDTDRHLIMNAPHPSPLSAHRGFFGCKHFSKANDYLIQTEQVPITWQID